MGRSRRDRGTAWVAGLRESVQRWRSSRQKGRAMPEELWATAAALAKVHGVYAVSRAVGLSYASLRRHLEPREGLAHEAATAHGGFVEVRATQILASSPTASPLLEVWDGRGAHLAVRLGTPEHIDVVGVVRAFLGRQG